MDWDKVEQLMNVAEAAVKWPKLAPIAAEAMAELEDQLAEATKSGEARAKKQAEAQAKLDADAKKEAQAAAAKQADEDEKRRVYDEAHRNRPPIPPGGPVSNTSTIADHNLNRRDIR